MRLALRNLSRRAARTSLSILGVGVGVAAIVAFTAMGEGFKVSIDKYGEQSGADLILVEEKAGDPAFGRILGEEMEELRLNPAVRAVSGSIVMPASMTDRATPLLVAGRNPDEDLIRTYLNPALRGRLLETEEEAMLGEIAAAELGLGVGDELEILRLKFRVVGVYSTAVRWENGGAVIHAQVLREQLSMPPGSVMVAFVYLKDPDDLPLVTLGLQARFPHLRVLPTAFLASSFEQLAYIDSFIWVISLAALLVGAIGVLNTMLMSVSERTREIGTRRALGATRRHIIQQFLTETIVLTASGGLLGVLFGLLCGPLFRGLRGAVTIMSPDLLPPIVYTLEPRIAPWSVALSLFISIGVGLIFGVYPARHAAYMDPIEALRHD